MLIFNSGKPLGTGDLSFLVRDMKGALVDPVSISYTIFSLDANGNPVSPVTDPNSTPVHSNLGSYFVNMTIPTTWNGGYRLVWYVQQYPTSAVEQVTMDFQVVQLSPAMSSFDACSMLVAANPGLTPKSAKLVVAVRELLSDTNPDRNYHFRPPTAGRDIAGFTSRVGFIWTDVTIIRMLRVAISKLNMGNPKALFNYNIDTIPEDWGNVASVGAAALCLTSEAARWAADGEWNYSLNGISLDIHKASTYQSLAESYRAEFDAMVPLVTANRPASCGLRQQRWLLGALALCAFLPLLSTNVIC
jgi:hypothetical protein